MICKQILKKKATDFSWGNKIELPQGGWTDGKVYYQVFINPLKKKEPDTYQKARLIKYDIRNPEKPVLLTVSEEFQLEHANDITYNSKTKEVVVCYNFGNRKIGDCVAIFDENLNFLRDEKLPYENGIHAIDYHEGTDRYVVGLSGDDAYQGAYVAILDSHFQKVGERIKLEGYVTKEDGTYYIKQQICCDDRYVSCLMYDQPDTSKEEYINIISVHDWNGNFVKRIILDITDGEAENISAVGDDIYVGVGSRDTFTDEFDGEQKKTFAVSLYDVQQL